MLRERIKPYLYVLPAVVLYATFTAYPVIRSVQMSFLNYEFIKPDEARFVGLDNYREALNLYSRQEKRNDEKTPVTLFNTLGFTAVFLPPYVLLPIPVAFLIDRLRRGQVFFRVVTFLPIVVSGAVIAVLWQTLYHPTYGPITAVIRGLLGPGGVADHVGSWLTGASHLAWTDQFKQYSLLGNEKTALASLAVMSVWHGFGFNVLLYLVTLAGIPQELYEAAAVDGAGRWKTFQHVTLPLLRPAVYLVTVLGTIGSLKVFGPMFIMTGGGPGNTTVSVVMYIYQTAFTLGNLRFGYAAAQAFLLAIVVLTFAVTASRLNRPVDR